MFTFRASTCPLFTLTRTMTFPVAQRPPKGLLDPDQRELILKSLSEHYPLQSCTSPDAVMFDVSVGINPTTNKLQVLNSDETETAISKMKSSQSNVHFAEPFLNHAIREEIDRQLHSPSPARLNPTNLKPALKPLNHENELASIPKQIANPQKPFAFQRDGAVGLQLADRGALSALELFTVQQTVVAELDSAPPHSNRGPFDMQRYVQVPNMAVHNSFDSRGNLLWTAPEHGFESLANAEHLTSVDEGFVNEYRHWVEKFNSSTPSDSATSRVLTAEKGHADLAWNVEANSTSSMMPSVLCPRKHYFIDEASAKMLHTKHLGVHNDGVDMPSIPKTLQPSSCVPPQGSPSFIHTSLPQSANEAPQSSRPHQGPFPVTLSPISLFRSINAVGDDAITITVEELPSPRRRTVHDVESGESVANARGARNVKQEVYYREQLKRSGILDSSTMKTANGSPFVSGVTDVSLSNRHTLSSKHKKGPEPVATLPESIIYDTMRSLNISDHSGAIQLAKRIGEMRLFNGSNLNPYVHQSSISANASQTSLEPQSYLLSSPPRVRPLRVFDEVSAEELEKRALSPYSPLGAVRQSRATTYNAMAYNPTYRSPAANASSRRSSGISKQLPSSGIGTPLAHTPFQQGSGKPWPSVTDLSNVNYSSTMSPPSLGHRDILQCID